MAGDGTDGTVTGMAPDAELMVIGIDCFAPDSIGWAASDYAIDNGAHIITESFVWPWAEDTPDFEGWRRQTDTQLAAGVIHVNAAGNDGGTPFNLADNLASELERMVAAGMSCVEALATANSTAAELLRMAKQIGTVEPGKLADLIVLDADPQADISAVRQVNMVIKAGQQI